MGDQNINYLYVIEPPVSSNMEMINILAPIINVNDKSTTQRTDTNNYENIIINSKPAEIIEVKTEEKEVTEIDLKRYEKLQKDILRKKMARMKETEEQRNERLLKDRERKKRSRQNETLEQRRRRLEKDRLRIQRRRAMESEEERRRRLDKNRISKRNARIREHNNNP